MNQQTLATLSADLRGSGRGNAICNVLRLEAKIAATEKLNEVSKILEKLGADLEKICLLPPRKQEEKPSLWGHCNADFA
jgi:hypothetical protein